MKTAILTNTINGVSVKVHATTAHPANSYGRAIWIDNDNNPYCEVDNPSPLFKIEYVSDDEDILYTVHELYPTYDADFTAAGYCELIKRYGITMDEAQDIIYTPSEGRCGNYLDRSTKECVPVIDKIYKALGWQPIDWDDWDNLEDAVSDCWMDIKCNIDTWITDDNISAEYEG